MTETDVGARCARIHTWSSHSFRPNGMIIDNDRNVVVEIENAHVPGLNGDSAERAPHRGEQSLERSIQGRRWISSVASRNMTSKVYLLWQLNLEADNYITHHDFAVKPNGNILAIVWESVTTDEAISQGRNPENVSEDGDFWYDGVIEVDPYACRNRLGVECPSSPGAGF